MTFSIKVSSIIKLARKLINSRLIVPVRMVKLISEIEIVSVWNMNLNVFFIDGSRIITSEVKGDRTFWARVWLDACHS